MKLSKLTLVSVGILLGVNSLASCTGNVKSSKSSLTHEYADCVDPVLKMGKEEKASTVAVVSPSEISDGITSSRIPTQEFADFVSPVFD